MAPRIESAEVISFRLHLPSVKLAQLAHELRNEVPLTLVEDTTGLRLSREDGESFMRFRLRGDEAFLVEVGLSNDDLGLFFQRVLGALMVQHRGDLQAKLVWNIAERNTHGQYALVNVRQGVSTYPGLSSHANSLRNTLVAASAGEGGNMAANPTQAPSLEEEELAEVERLLARGKAHWEEYQRLKGRK